MSDTDEGAKKLLEACDDMLDLHRRQGTEDGTAARQVAAKRREVERRLRRDNGIAAGHGRRAEA